MAFTGDLFQILALDGGGAKALFSAHLLARLEEDLELRIIDCFDLIAGTSAGGIVALGLGAGLAPAEILGHYEELVKRVFPTRKQSRWRAGRLFRPAYDIEVLREVLSDVLGSRILGDSAKRLVIPSWDVQVGEVRIFKTPHHERLVRDWKIPMVDVGLATAAAPVYFQAADVDQTRLIDGGVWANNPSVVAITEAYSMLGVPLEKMRVLNIGTMGTVTDHSPRLHNAGILRWGTAAVSVILTASSRSTIGTARHLVGFDRFVRFDVNVPPKSFTLDAIDAQQVAAYAGEMGRQFSRAFTEKFAGHRAATYEPLKTHVTRLKP